MPDIIEEFSCRHPLKLQLSNLFQEYTFLTYSFYYCFGHSYNYCILKNKDYKIVYVLKQICQLLIPYWQDLSTPCNPGYSPALPITSMCKLEGKNVKQDWRMCRVVWVAQSGMGSS